MPPSGVGRLHWAPGRALSHVETGLIRALLAAALLASGSQVAHTAAPAWAAECAALDDDAARLACYDSRNPPRKATARAQGTAPPPVSPSNDFGLTEQKRNESARAAKEAEATDLAALVDSVSTRLTGELLLKLDNGQSWVQAQRKPGVIIKAGERVSISRGSFGGYLLRSDSGATMRVRRLE